MLTKFRRVLFGLLLCSTAINAEIVYDFDDGTFQGWDFILPDGSPFDADDSDVGWLASDEDIDIGDGFSLLEATTGNFRVVPDPWSARDCIGGVCSVQILRSPEFELDGSGDLSIDMIGGGATGSRAFDPDLDFAPESPDDFEEFKGSGGLQGFALLDVAANEYVLHGFSTGENDGKARDTDPEHRGFWETVTLEQADLAAYANNGKTYQVDIFDSYSGGWGWIGFDTVRIPAGGGVLGDFNSDGNVDAADIDLMTAELGKAAPNLAFDLNGDSLVDSSDRRSLIVDIQNTYLGDSNLDGEFNSSDFVQVFGAGEYEDGVAGNSTWATGDWDGNFEFDSGDFVAAFSDGGYEIGPRPAAAQQVPEPTSWLGLMLAAGILAWTGRRNA